jgi:adenosylmethionine-8-amino-7-oxononanoate aminotransferase
MNWKSKGNSALKFDKYDKGDSQMKSTEEVLDQNEIQELRDQAAENLWLPYLSLSQYDPDHVHIYVSGDGCRITDAEGKSYYDAFAGLMYKAVGYGRKEIADAAYAQMLKLTSPAQMDVGTVPAIRLSAKLAEITPGTLSRTHFVCGGTEANEVAVKTAKHYQQLAGSGKRYKIIARSGEYHGFSHLAMGMGRHNGWIYSPFEPSVPGIRHIPHPYCYRCPLDLNYPDCGILCAKELERVIKDEDPNLVAAFLTVSISQQTPAAVPPPEYWPIIREICDKYGVLLIDDEVVCGFGRTGKMFGIEQFGVVPDIMTVAKGLTSGYMPLGACITSSKIGDTFREKGDIFRNVVTFGGLPACCAAGLANIDIIEKEKLVERAASMGDYVSDKLQQLWEHQIVGDIRGIGLFWGVEIVRDKKTKEPLDFSQAERLQEILREGGLITRVDDGVIRFMPPLIITKEEIDECMKIIDNAIGKFEKEI